MTYERSAGAVVFTRISNEIKYVIIRSPQGYYGFPKGHIEAGESEEQAAFQFESSKRILTEANSFIKKGL